MSCDFFTNIMYYVCVCVRVRERERELKIFVFEHCRYSYVSQLVELQLTT